MTKPMLDLFYRDSLVARAVFAGQKAAAPSKTAKTASGERVYFGAARLARISSGSLPFTAPLKPSTP